MSTTSPPIQLQAKDLTPHGGVFCPNPRAKMELWNSHPRVYLDLGHTGRAKCPYCGTEYVLPADLARSHAH